MLYSFKQIDNHLQRQLLKLMVCLDDNSDAKRAIYLGYSVIRNHLINIINKIQNYFMFHNKLNNFYSINDMYIYDSKPKFIIPSLSDDVYDKLGKEIKTYLNGFDLILGINDSNYNILNNIYYFKHHFADCCYNSIYYALKELGTNDFNNLNLLVHTLTDKDFFDANIGIMDIPSIFDFDRYNKYYFGWNGYHDKYSITHKEFKKYKKLLKDYNNVLADTYDSDEAYLDNSYDDLNTGDQIFYRYIKNMLIENNKLSSYNDNSDDNIDKLEEDLESDNEKKKSNKKKSINKIKSNKNLKIKEKSKNKKFKK